MATKRITRKLTPEEAKWLKSRRLRKRLQKLHEEAVARLTPEDFDRMKSLANRARDKRLLNMAVASPMMQ